MANCLKQKVDVADKMVASQEAVRQHSIEAGEEAKNLQPKLELIITKTKELQGEVRCDRQVVHSIAVLWVGSCTVLLVITVLQYIPFKSCNI